MMTKKLISTEHRRVLAPPFAWVDRRLLLHGFLDTLAPHEILLYFFLILAADRDGLSFYSYDKICQMLKLDLEDYITARNALIDKQLLAFDGRQFQVLALPMTPAQSARQLRRCDSTQEAQAFADLLRRWSQNTD